MNSNCPHPLLDAMDSGDDYDEEALQVADAVDYESILTRAEGEPQPSDSEPALHYRSRRRDVAFSNKVFLQ
jgi:hypothetical protein